MSLTNTAVPALQEAASLIKPAGGELHSQSSFDHGSSSFQTLDLTDGAPNIKLILSIQCRLHRNKCMLKVGLGHLEPVSQIGDSILMRIHVRYPRENNVARVYMGLKGCRNQYAQRGSLR
ncbi:hypothetical protein M5J07_17765 [Achromobacter mucicolens]|uniref:hypothetical protein n=1 Tax=Achromobacter TaxID=222 RepID=UPI0020A341E1|nr:hypothetical protein [Achromobacter mucicolens]MCP2516791.1 hypothetical protein [Achromobacter mucicolens]